MFGRQERLALALLFLVLVSVIASHLVLGHIGKRPFASPYSDQSEEGALVVLSGTIDAISVTRQGGHVVLQIQNSTVFIPNTIATGLALRTGTNVTVIGTVKTYQGKKEVVIESVSDIISGS